MEIDRLEENLEIIPVRKAESVDKFALGSKLAIWLSCFAPSVGDWASGRLSCAGARAWQPCRRVHKERPSCSCD